MKRYYDKRYKQKLHKEMGYKIILPSEGQGWDRDEGCIVTKAFATLPQGASHGYTSGRAIDTGLGRFDHNASRAAY